MIAHARRRLRLRRPGGLAIVAGLAIAMAIDVARSGGSRPGSRDTACPPVHRRPASGSTSAAGRSISTAVAAGSPTSSSRPVPAATARPGPPSTTSSPRRPGPVPTTGPGAGGAIRARAQRWPTPRPTSGRCSRPPASRARSWSSAIRSAARTAASSPATTVPRSSASSWSTRSDPDLQEDWIHPLLGPLRAEYEAVSTDSGPTCRQVDCARLDGERRPAAGGVARRAAGRGPRGAARRAAPRRGDQHGHRRRARTRRLRRSRRDASAT